MKPAKTATSTASKSTKRGENSPLALRAMISADEHAPQSPYSRDAAPAAVTPLNMVKKKKKQQKQAGSAVRLPHHVPALSLMLPKEKWLAAPPLRQTDRSWLKSLTKPLNKES